MDSISQGLIEAVKIIFSLNPDFLRIAGVSLKLSIVSTSLTVLLAVPFGIGVVYSRFPGKNLLLTVLNTLMSLPTVLVGLMVYSFLSRRGPMGEWNLLYTQTAIIMGQVILIFPIIAALTISVIKGLDLRIRDTILALGADRFQNFKMVLYEARYGITSAIITGFGRVFAEVGISMMVGGNLKNYTRTITTAIALETSKGEFALGIALGLVLLVVSFGVNLFLFQFQRSVKR